MQIASFMKIKVGLHFSEESIKYSEAVVAVIVKCSAVK